MKKGKKTENSRETKMYKLARKSSRLKHKQINLKKHIIIVLYLNTVQNYVFNNIFFGGGIYSNPPFAMRNRFLRTSSFSKFLGSIFNFNWPKIF